MGIDYLKENKEKDWSSLLSEIPKMPILLIQGEKDEDVPFEFSKELAKKYKNIELKILSEADHKFSEFDCRKRLIELTTNWLKKYL